MSQAGGGDGCSLSTYSQGMGYSSTAGDSGTDNLLTPASTPTQTRKSRRRSNLFTANVSDYTAEISTTHPGHLPQPLTISHHPGFGLLHNTAKRCYIQLLHARIFTCNV